MVIPHYAAQELGQGVRADKPLSPRGTALPRALRPTAEDNLRSYQAWLAEREHRKARARKVSFRVR